MSYACPWHLSPERIGLRPCFGIKSLHVSFNTGDRNIVYCLIYHCSSFGTHYLPFLKMTLTVPQLSTFCDMTVWIVLAMASLSSAKCVWFCRVSLILCWISAGVLGSPVNLQIFETVVSQWILFGATLCDPLYRILWRQKHTSCGFYLLELPIHWSA